MRTGDISPPGLPYQEGDFSCGRLTSLPMATDSMLLGLEDKGECLSPGPAEILMTGWGSHHEQRVVREQTRGTETLWVL